jgi:hypothetical protein
MNLLPKNGLVDDIGSGRNSDFQGKSDNKLV